MAIHYVLYLLGAVLVLTLGASQVSADSITGTIESTFSTYTSKATDATGVTTKRDATNYNPRFTLNIEKWIYPNLRLSAGGFFEKSITDTETDGESTKSTLTRMRPFVDLTLMTPLYTAGVGYNRREETIDATGASAFTTVNEEYSGILGWRPDGFPSTELRFIKTNTFDEDRDVLDIAKDFLSLNSRYQVRGLTADYFGTYTKTKDNLNNVETEDTLHSGRFTYSRIFFNDRISVNSTYNVSHQEVKTTSEGQGFVSLQVFAFAGLSAIDDTPDVDALLPNPALVDGDLTAASGINIGVPPLGGNDDRRNIGLDLLTATEVNNLLVWVDRELPLGIANSFSWEIFTSSDNLNWTRVATLIQAPFAPFQNRFEITFPNVTTRFIKVAVSPLTPGAAATVPSFPNPDVINVTEFQAFIRRPVADVEGRVTRTSHIYSLDTKTRILDFPHLYHELSYFYTKVDPSGDVRYNLSNGFSADHQFSRVFSGNARVAREDGKEADGDRVSYVYTAAINAVPLRTLRHNLIFSGREEEVDSEKNSNHSLFLNNTAELYRGIDVSLNGGLTYSKQPTGEKQEGTLFDVIATIVPRRDLTINLTYSGSTTRRSGGQRDSTDYTRRGEISVAYNPFITLNLFASLEVVAIKGEKVETNQNYSLNWSPFPDGALQFNFLYDESLRSEDNSRNRLIIPSVRWNITKKSYIDLAFRWNKTDSDTSKLDQKLISTNVKIYF
jgi:hypothetical protein